MPTCPIPRAYSMAEEKGALTDSKRSLDRPLEGPTVDCSLRQSAAGSPLLLGIVHCRRGRPEISPDGLGEASKLSLLLRPRPNSAPTQRRAGRVRREPAALAG